MSWNISSIFIFVEVTSLLTTNNHIPLEVFSFILLKVGSPGTRFNKDYGLCALHHSMETPTNRNCCFMKSYNENADIDCVQ